MAFTPEKLAERLEAEGRKTVAFFAALPDAAWNQRLYTEGERWQVRQVLTHLAQAENAVRRLMQSILAGSEGTPVDFDLDAYNERKVRELAEAEPAAIAARFEQERRETIAWMRALSPDDLAVTGRHPFLGVVPIEEMVKLLYRHTQLHQRDVRRGLDGGA